MRKELKLLIPKEQNPYYKNNPEYFDELLDLVQEHYRGYGKALVTTRQYLMNWINDILPILNNNINYQNVTKVYWILNGLTDFPKCQYCECTDNYINKNIISLEYGYHVYCSVKCMSHSEEVQNKKEYTTFEHYSVKNPSQSVIIRQKVENTCLQNYGETSPMKSPKIIKQVKDTKQEKYGDPNYNNMEKNRNTCINKYGYVSSLQVPEIRKAGNQTKLEKYGSKTYNNRKKAEETCKNLYGTKYYSQSDDFQQKVPERQRKRHITLKRNGTFNTSRPEELAFSLLVKVFPDLVRQYRSDAYPFHCDFYSPSFDLYIEFNGTWTHGGHEFDPRNPDDTAKVRKWKAKGTRYYDNAIRTWTIRDKKKFETARKNCLNYIVFWNIQEVNRYLSEFLAKFVSEPSK